MVKICNKSKVRSNSKRSKNLSPKSGSIFFDQSSTRQPKVFIKTFGCQMNMHDSERMRDLLLEDGYFVTDKPEEADVLLFNTCSVRKHAEDRVWSDLGKYKAPPKFAPANLSRGGTRPMRKIIGLVGCMAEAQKDSIFKRLPHVDFLCGPADIDRVPEIIERIKSRAGRLIYLGGYKSKRIPGFPAVRGVGKNAYVKIMEGCNNFCSYCIVPYVRGTERSRPSREILDEIKGLIDKGVKKITLLGQNVNSYGRGLREKITFPGLLRKIDRDCFVPTSSGLAMTRVKVDFVTSHPKDAGVDLFRAMAELGYLSKQLHLPLQSGSNKVLRRMNRGYTVEKYKRLIRDFRRIVKNGCIISDFIVGFPGERDVDFNDTLKAVKEIQFDAAYIFKYSPRPFTRAGRFKDDVPRVEKERRHALLLKVQKGISLRKQ